MVRLMPSSTPPIADVAPDVDALTPYDEEQAITYLRLLDADAEGAPWQDAARIVLEIDPVNEPERARIAHETHLARAIQHKSPWLASGADPGSAPRAAFADRFERTSSPQLRRQRWGTSQYPGQ